MSVQPSIVLVVGSHDINAVKAERQLLLVFNGVPILHRQTIGPSACNPQEEQFMGFALALIGLLIEGDMSRREQQSLWRELKSLMTDLLGAIVLIQ